MKHVINAGKKYAVFLLAVIGIILCITRFGQVKDGVKNGIGICTGSILPSLFPMLILTAFLTYTGIPRKIRSMIFCPIGLISGSSQLCTEVFLFGSVSGYPVGVKTAVALYGQRNVQLKEFQTAALANVNPGLAFSVLIAGKQCFGSVNAGITMYISVCIGNLMLCQLLRGKIKPANRFPVADYKNEQPSEALVHAVDSAVKSTVSISAWITAFCAAASLFGNVLTDSPYVFFTEVTGAVIYCASATGLPMCAFCMAFGGFCILFQLLPELRKLKISVPKYLLSRLLSAVCAYASERVFLYLLPESALASACGRIILEPAVGSFWLSGALALLCTVFIVSNMTAQTTQKRYLRSRIFYDKI